MESLSPQPDGTAAPSLVYLEPVVLDAGDVAAVTLGKNTFDRVDNTQYKDK